ncbi:MAG: hypothetical protein LCH54_02865 [Bacteroidetes bacterium]|nr:hypothetical protein [Bacteroidota bacterium]
MKKLIVFFLVLYTTSGYSQPDRSIGIGIHSSIDFTPSVSHQNYVPKNYITIPVDWDYIRVEPFIGFLFVSDQKDSTGSNAESLNQSSFLYIGSKLFYTKNFNKAKFFIGSGIGFVSGFEIEETSLNKQNINSRIEMSGIIISPQFGGEFYFYENVSAGIGLEYQIKSLKGKEKKITNNFVNTNNNFTYTSYSIGCFLTVKVLFSL